MKHDYLIIDGQGKAAKFKSLSRMATWAPAMALPISRTLNYHDLARKVLQIQPLPQGALPIYDRNIGVASIVVESGFKNDRLRIASDGNVYDTNRLRAHRVVFPTFDMVSTPIIRIDDVKKRRFSMMDRGRKGLFIDSSGKTAYRRASNWMSGAVQKAKQRIMQQEDERIFRALDSIFQIESENE